MEIFIYNMVGDGAKLERMKVRREMEGNTGNESERANEVTKNMSIYLWYLSLDGRDRARW